MIYLLISEFFFVFKTKQLRCQQINQRVDNILIKRLGLRRDYFISNPFSLKKCILHKRFSSPKEERCDLILWSFCCFRWIDLSPRRAFYGQENCNLSLYKSTRISLTNAILYSQSPVYLQQLRRLERGRILNSTAHIVYNKNYMAKKSSNIKKTTPDVGLSCTYCLNVPTTPLRQWGFRQCFPFSWTTLRGKHCQHPIAVMGVVDMFEQYYRQFIY